MKRFANNSKWSELYSQLDIQAKNNKPIIFYRIPEGISEQEIEEVIQELNSVGNFKNYSIFRNEQNIKGVRVICADVSEAEGEYIRHNPELTAKQIIEIIVNDLKFKDKKTDEHYVLLNAKLKEAKKKIKAIKKPRNMSSALLLMEVYIHLKENIEESLFLNLLIKV